MKRITFNVKDFTPVVNKAMGVINGKGSLSIFNDLVIKSKNGENAIIRSSDGEVWITQRAELVKQDDFEEVCFAVNAGDFASILKTLAGNVVTITIDEGSQTIVGTYENGDFRLPYDDASVFPLPSDGSEQCSRLSVGAQKILSAIDNTRFAASTSEVHKVLNGIRFNMTGSGIETEATDMVVMSVYTDTTVDVSDLNGGFTLPNKTANVVSRMLADVQDDVVVSYNDRVVIFENESFKMVSRLQEGSFPQCSRVIRPDSEIMVTICKKDLQNALRRVIPMSDTASQVILFTFENNCLTISAEDVVFSKAGKEKVKCNYDGERFCIGFKGSRIAEMLSVVDYENVVFGMESPKKPAMVTPEVNNDGIVHSMLLMPVAINMQTANS